MISQAGFDWVMIDMEHSALSLETIQISLAVFGQKILKIVRVPGNDEIWIKRILDTGCDGIMVPMINTGEAAERAVQSVKYPPEGRRSVGLSRAHGYGQSFKKYLDAANSEIVLMAQIEHIEGVKNIDSILRVRGVDSVFIGPYDLSASMGLAGEVNHPEVRKAIEIIKKRCDKAGIAWGIFCADPEALKQELKDKCTYGLCGIDISLFSNALISLRGNFI
jgi:2-keto-3-deoxy-L-rhamnonate aldolase RhmA